MTLKMNYLGRDGSFYHNGMILGEFY